MSDQGYELDSFFANYHVNVDDINCLMFKYGRVLFAAGKSYNQYAET